MSKNYLLGVASYKDQYKQDFFENVTACSDSSNPEYFFTNLDLFNIFPKTP